MDARASNFGTDRVSNSIGGSGANLGAVRAANACAVRIAYGAANFIADRVANAASAAVFRGGGCKSAGVLSAVRSPLTVSPPGLGGVERRALSPQGLPWRVSIHWRC